MNQKIIELNLNIEPYKKEDLIGLFSNAVILQAVDPDREQYLKSIVISISSLYPELLPSLNEKLSFLDKTKEERILYLVDELSSKFQDIPIKLIQQVKETYSTDTRPFSQIGKEIVELFRIIMFMESIIDVPVNQEVLEQSILLIGPMEREKSIISKKLVKRLICLFFL